MASIKYLFIFLLTISCKPSVPLKHVEAEYTIAKEGILVIDEAINLSSFEHILDTDPPNINYIINVSPVVRFLEFDSVLQLLKKKNKKFKFQLIKRRATKHIKNRLDVPENQLPEPLQKSSSR